MEYEAQKVGEVEGLGTIYRINAPLDGQLQAFKKVGIITLATPEEVAQIRLANIPNNESRTNVAPIAIRGGKTILLRDSPLMNPLMAAYAVNAHGKGEYPLLGKEVYEVAEAIAKAETEIAPEDRSAILVSQDGDFGLKTEMDEARFLLREHNQKYFEKFVKNGKEGQIPFYNLTGNSKDRAVVNYLWFSSPQSESNLICRSRSLYDDNSAFAVLRTAEGSAPKKGYTLIEIEKANSEIIPVVFERAKVSDLASRISRDLNKSLLEKLREQ